MPKEPYTDRVNIVKYVKIAGKWTFAPVAKRPNGTIYWDHVLVNKQPEHHPEGKYYIEWRDPGRIRKPVGTIPAEVLAEAHRQRALLNAKAAGVGVVEDEAKGPKKRLSSDAVSRYLRDVEMNKAHSTFTHYTHCLELFQQAVQKTYIEDLDRDDLMDYQAFLYNLGLGARTVKNKTTVIASFLKTFGVGKLLNKGDWPRYTEDDPESYTQEELKVFFAACTSEEYELFQFYLQSGFREQEVCHTEWPDINYVDGVAKVSSKNAEASGSHKFEPKSRRTREVPLPDFLLALMKARQKKSKSKLCYPSREHSKAPKARPGGKPAHQHLMYCKQIALRAGLNCGNCQNAEGEICAVAPCCEHWYLHKFRATFATMHLQDGVDIVTVSKWLGHKDIKTTMRYLAALRREEGRKKVNAGLLASTFAPPAKRKRGDVQKLAA